VCALAPVARLQVYSTGKVAVKGVSFGVQTGEVFGFLGINGAGKTTTLQMLSGDVLPSSGTAKLGGYDILSQQPQVRRLLGYTPQFDALLDPLTVREHLELYARIKGVSETALKGQVDTKLVEMDLTKFANKKAMSLSGGNKRKLSVACAMMGNPAIVFLDEPSTGMDPVARRFMWSVISRIAADKHSSVILTTHSMEEVQALCQRVGIMVGGQLQCIGSIQHLKNRFGQGLLGEVKLDAPAPGVAASMESAIRRAIGAPPTGPALIARRQLITAATALGNVERAAEVSESGTGWALNAAFARSPHPSPAAGALDRAIPVPELAQWWAEEEGADRVIAYVTAEAFPGAALTERQGTLLRFRIPPQPASLGVLFGRLETARTRLGIASYSLSQTTLEQLFNSFAAGTQNPETGHGGVGADGKRVLGGAGTTTTPLPTPAAV